MVRIVENQVGKLYLGAHVAYPAFEICELSLLMYSAFTHMEHRSCGLPTF